MNFLGITPNTLYKQFITNPELMRKIEINEQINKKIDEWDSARIQCLFEIVEALDKL